jgi:hypothetical protein
MLDNSESEETLSSDNEYVLENDFELDDESEIKEAEKADSDVTMRPENLDDEDAVISLTTGFPTMTRKPSLGA